MYCSQYSFIYDFCIVTVRVVEPARAFPYITTPSRSRLGSVDVETATVKANLDQNQALDHLPVGEQMLSASFHAMKTSPVNRLVAKNICGTSSSLTTKDRKLGQ